MSKMLHYHDAFNGSTFIQLQPKSLHGLWVTCPSHNRKVLGSIPALIQFSTQRFLCLHQFSPTASTTVNVYNAAFSARRKPLAIT